MNKLLGKVHGKTIQINFGICNICANKIIMKHKAHSLKFQSSEGREMYKL